MLQRGFFLILTLALSHTFASSAEEKAEYVCKSSIVIKTLKDFDLIRNCTVIVGHVRIENMNLTTTMTTMQQQQLSTAVEEITDYLLVFRVHGLKSLRYIFPHLVIIRGQDKLLFDQYSLVVYENQQLLDLGLKSLLRIQRGSIRIESNPMLCYVSTVNWVYLLRNSTQQRFSLRNNKSPNHCPLCNSTLAEEMVAEQNLNKHCWDFETLQQRPTKSRLFKSKCSKDCGIHGCSESDGFCCNANCLTECMQIECKKCAGFKLNHKCVDTCTPFTYKYNKRECVSAEFCRIHGLIPHAGTCLEKCPEYYEQVNNNNNMKGNVECRQQCIGNYTIRTAKDLTGLKDCIKITGSLTITLTEMKAKIINHLDDMFMNVQEITGYLKVMRSPQLLSLSFLRNLHTIRGDELIDNKYALYVVDNHHLEHIWTANQHVSIFNGHLYFHLNPRLCYEKIIQLQPFLKTGKNITIMDASPNSNGERIICGNAVRLLNASVEDFNSTAALIKVNLMPADDKDVLIGYSHHYMEAPLQNITMYDGRHGCGRDNWRMDITTNRNIRHIITDLKPYTQYAYFVKTITMTDYHRQYSAYSNIQYFRTLPSKPSAVAKIYYHALSDSEIQVHWWPPLNPNGIIDRYLLHYEKVDVSIENVTKSGYNNTIKLRKLLDNCQCSAVDPILSGPSPEDENYYSKEQITYDEAVPDIMFTARIENITDNHIQSNLTAEERRRNFEKFKMDLENKAIAEQDTGRVNFPILKPHPICAQVNASTQFKLENSCTDLEVFEGTPLPGHVHSYIIIDLEPEVTYRISIRACAKNVENGCGGENTVIAETVSKTLGIFLKNLKNDN